MHTQPTTTEESIAYILRHMSIEELRKTEAEYASLIGQTDSVRYTLTLVRREIADRVRPQPTEDALALRAAETDGMIPHDYARGYAVGLAILAA
jgi:hypothetical protein